MDKVFQELLAKVKPYEDIVYHEPMNEEDIEAFQRRVGVKFKSSFRKFLQYIGLVQDLIEAINVGEEIIIEHYDFIKEAHVNYLPIHFSDGFDEDVEEDRLLLINNNSEDDDWLYELNVSDDDEIGELKKTGNTFSGLIENSYDELVKTKKKRVKNEDKIRLIEYKIITTDFDTFASRLGKQFEQITPWRDKYHPNIFGDQLAEFIVLGERIEIERDEGHKAYKFEYEEPVAINRADSKFKALEALIGSTGIKNEMVDFGIINLE